jgi:hypothetical protein
VTQRPRWLRWLIASLGGAALAAAVFIIMIWLGAQQNPNGWVHGQPLMLMFLDPFVLTVAATVAVPSGLAAFALAVLWLDTTVIWKTTTLMYSAVLLELALVGSRDLDRALWFAYPTLLAAAVVSKVLFKRTVPPTRPTRRGGDQAGP